MANIKKHSLFVVQTNDTVNSIRYDAIKADISPLAVQENEVLNLGGSPGIMFPGKTLIYDRVTGQVDVAINAIREFKGAIGYEEDQRPNMTGNEKPGNFYIVSDFNYKYAQNDWGTLGSDLENQNRLYLGDVVEKKNDGSGDWTVIPMQIGNQHIHNDFMNYLHISTVTSDSVVASNIDTITGGTVISTSGSY
jgi:hypothetical protein